jgi:hypothetical protein
MFMDVNRKKRMRGRWFGYTAKRAVPVASADANFDEVL